jgi:MarR family transcriptional regulator, organic hydroperoxide resistance regulator
MLNDSDTEGFEVDSASLVDEAVQLLPQIVRRMQTTYTGFAEASGLTFGQMKALTYLYHNGRSTIGEVADGLGLAMPTASELIDKLAERHLVEREINPHNRRQVHVWLTDTAMEFGRELYELRRGQIREAFSGLNPGEQAAVVRGLRALSEAVGSMPVGSCPYLDAATSPRATSSSGS